MKRAERLLREGSVVLARPNGLNRCENPECNIYYRPSYSGSRFCPVCVREGAHLGSRVCAYEKCGKTFQPHHATALYHSDSCRQLSYAARKGAAA